MSNKSEKYYIMELAKAGLRQDGRGLLEFRKPVTIEYNVSNNAEGSATVSLGKTKVTAGVKLEIGTPYPDNPDEGSIVVNAELSPIASPNFEPGPPNEYGIELARVVDRSIRESKAVNTKDLCITPGEKVWVVLIDLYIQNHDGNLIDASNLAAMAALKNTKYPKFDGEKIDYHIHEEKSLKIDKIPIEVTFVKIGDIIMADPTEKEEEVADARLTIAIDENGTVHALQKGGEEGISEEEFSLCLENALKLSKDLRKYL